VFPVGATGVRETEFQEQMFRNELRVKFTSDNAVLACQSIDEIVGKFRNPLLSGGGGDCPGIRLVPARVISCCFGLISDPG
jgi:hypothetical protein